MASRVAVLLLAVLLIPAAAMAQRASATVIGHTGQATGSGGSGFGHHTGGTGTGLAPQLGFGNVNHPGLGFAPNTPGIGFPLANGMQPMPTPQPLLVGPIRPGITGPGITGDGFHHRHHGFTNGGVIFVPVPVAVPVVVGGYSVYGYNGVAYAGAPAAQAPTVVIVQQAPGQASDMQQEPPTWNGPTRVIPSEDRDRQIIYETRPPASDETASKPLTLLVFKDHSIYAVVKYWKQDDRLYYVTNYGAENSVSLDQLDLEFTRRLNAERNVKFEL